MKVPAFIALLDAKPGRDWTPDEAMRVAAWWREREQERLVWYCATRFLGEKAIKEDVEEVWVDFYAKLILRAQDSYRPGGVGFCTYLLDVCLKNHCLKVRRNLGRRHEEPWTEIELHLRPPEDAPHQSESDPSYRAEQQAFLDALNAALNQEDIHPGQRDAFLLRYINQLSYPEIAHALGVPEGTAKGWVHRITARLYAKLQAQGWEL